MQKIKINSVSWYINTKAKPKSLIKKNNKNKIKSKEQLDNHSVYNFFLKPKHLSMLKQFNRFKQVKVYNIWNFYGIEVLRIGLIKF